MNPDYTDFDFHVGEAHECVERSKKYEAMGLLEQAWEELEKSKLHLGRARMEYRAAGLALTKEITETLDKYDELTGGGW